MSLCCTDSEVVKLIRSTPILRRSRIIGRWDRRCRSPMILKIRACCLRAAFMYAVRSERSKRSAKQEHMHRLTIELGDELGTGKHYEKDSCHSKHTWTHRCSGVCLPYSTPPDPTLPYPTLLFPLLPLQDDVRARRVILITICEMCFTSMPLPRCGSVPSGTVS